MRLVWTQTLGLLLGLVANTHRMYLQWMKKLLALVTEIDKSAAWIPIKVEGVTSNSWWKGWVWRLSGVLSPCGGRSLHHPPAQPRWASNELPPAPASSQWGASGVWSNSSVIAVSCGWITWSTPSLIHIAFVISVPRYYLALKLITRPILFYSVKVLPFFTQYILLYLYIVVPV